MPFIGRRRRKKPKRDVTVKCGRTWRTRDGDHTHQCRLNYGHHGAHICTFCTARSWKNN